MEFYSFVLLLPGALLNALSLVVFFLPPALSDKLAISKYFFKKSLCENQLLKKEINIDIGQFLHCVIIT